MRLARDVSLLRANGHPGAARYTPWQISIEAALVREYLHAQHAEQASMISAAIGAWLDSIAARDFSQMITTFLDPDS